MVILGAFPLEHVLLQSDVKLIEASGHINYKLEHFENVFFLNFDLLIVLIAPNLPSLDGMPLAQC